MLRLTEIKLPLDHPPEALRAAILARLGLGDGEMVGLRVYKRSYDARKRSAILLIYTVDVELAPATEARLLQLTGNHHENPTLDLPCREVFARGQRVVEVAGPMLEEEAAKAHAGFWK